MNRRQRFIFIVPICILLFLVIIAICANLSDNWKEFGQIKNIIMQIKEIHPYQDREVLDINRPVEARWHPKGVHVMIIPLDEEGDWIVDDYLDLSLILSFDGTPTYDNYSINGSKANYVEKFIDEVNEKHLNNIDLKDFIQKDLIVTLNFSDDSQIVFDRYYKEIEENIEIYHKYFIKQ